jgi:hypothetical protein
MSTEANRIVQKLWSYCTVLASGGSGGGGGRYYCKNLSKQEAKRLLGQGHTYLDRDGDGEACGRARIYTAVVKESGSFD